MTHAAADSWHLTVGFISKAIWDTTAPIKQQPASQRANGIPYPKVRVCLQIRLTYGIAR